jgi:hypothetical protein
VKRRYDCELAQLAAVRDRLYSARCKPKRPSRKAHGPVAQHAIDPHPHPAERGIRWLDLDALPRVSVSTHGDYGDYSSAPTQELGAQRFARDIAYFGYAL